MHFQFDWKIYHRDLAKRIAPPAAVLINTLVNDAIDEYLRSRKLRRVLDAINEELANPQTGEKRRKQLNKVREQLHQEKLKRLIDDSRLIQGSFR
jgi:hypothetical protein